VALLGGRSTLTLQQTSADYDAETGGKWDLRQMKM
jgi:hypothetical protein